MSKYTTEVRYICETFAGLDHSEGYSKVGEIIAAARAKVFNFDYPIYDEDYRPELETKILRHFYTREIGMETCGLWLLRLEDKMNAIMPLYNPMYAALKEGFNPLNDVDYTETGTTDFKTQRENSGNENQNNNRSRTVKQTGNSSNTTQSDTDSVNKFSATPQGGLQGILNDEYLTEATVDHNNGNATDQYNRNLSETETNVDTNNRNTVDNVSGNDVTDSAKHVVGKMNSGRTYAEMFADYKRNMVSIDQMIFDDLEELFMQVW